MVINPNVAGERVIHTKKKKKKLWLWAVADWMFIGWTIYRVVFPWEWYWVVCICSPLAKFTCWNFWDFIVNEICSPKKSFKGQQCFLSLSNDNFVYQSLKEWKCFYGNTCEPGSIYDGRSFLCSSFVNLDSEVMEEQFVLRVPPSVAERIERLLNENASSSDDASLDLSFSGSRTYTVIFWFILYLPCFFHCICDVWKNF